MDQEKKIETELNQFFQVQKSWRDRKTAQRKIKTETKLSPSGNLANG